jgi:hypothetical protein
MDYTINKYILAEIRKQVYHALKRHIFNSISDAKYISHGDDQIKSRPIIYNAFIERYDKKIWQLAKLEIDTWLEHHNLIIQEQLLTVNHKSSRLAYYCIEYYNMEQYDVSTEIYYAIHGEYEFRQYFMMYEKELKEALKQRQKIKEIKRENLIVKFVIENVTNRTIF